MLSSGTNDISFIDPVVIGRNAFSVTNDFVSGLFGYIQGVLCAVLDVILDTLKGTQSGKTSSDTMHTLQVSQTSRGIVLFSLLVRYPAFLGI